MTLSTAQTATEITELVPTESINSFVAGYEYAPLVGMSLAWTIAGQGSVPKDFPRWQQLDAGSGVPAGTKTETNTFTDVTLDTTRDRITPGFVGFRLPVSDEADRSSDVAIEASRLVQCLNALNDRMDSDIHASAASATNTVGAFTDSCTLEKFRAAVASWKALNLETTEAVCVLHSTPAATLLGGLHATSATMPKRPGDQLALGTTQGYIGSLYGFDVHESGNVASESGGHNNYMTRAGTQLSGIGLVVNEMPNIRVSRGDDAEARAVTYLVCRAWYGAGVCNADYLLEFRCE